MRLERLWFLSFLLPAAITVVACSSDPPKKKPTTTERDKNDKDKSGDDDDDDDDTDTQDSDLTKAPPAATTSPDAGRLPPPPYVTRPPPPQTQNCIRLGACCSKYDEWYMALTCGLAATQIDEQQCGVALPLCEAGSRIDFSNLIPSGHSECTSLSECCGELQRNGGESSGCASVVEYQDEAWCRDMHQQWSSAGHCR
jgi:hypothetical protein